MAGRVHLFEHHDETHAIWLGLDVRARALIHVDAHHDLRWLTDPVQLDIGNYVCQAIKDGIVSDVHWVVPDGALSSSRSRRALLRQLKQLGRDYDSAGAVSVSADRLSVALRGSRITVCECHTLPAINGPVLLDIDTDFMTTPSLSLRSGPSARLSPWLWPSELFQRLRRFDADVVTIAYSVEGGYTPLEWKFLGDELAALMSGAMTGGERAGYDALRRAHRHHAAGESDAAIRLYRHASDLLGRSAAPWFLLARVLADAGRLPEARQARAEMLARDPSYGTPYASRGLQALHEGRRVEAERAFLGDLAVNPDDAFAHAGLARLALGRRRWDDAERQARRAIEIGLQCPLTYRVLGRAFEKQRRAGEAIAAYEHSLRLSLDGVAPYTGLEASRLRGRLPVHDAGHGATYARLAALDARAGRAPSALASYRFALAAGADRASVHAGLARIYFARGDWRQCRSAMASAIALAPAEIARGLRGGWGRALARLTPTPRP